MSQTFLDIIAPLVNIVVVLGAALTSVPFIVVFERKIIGWVQQRPGPNRVGPWGLLQGLADGLKLFFKESIVVTGVDRVLYYLAPCFASVPALLLLCILPFAPPFWLVGDRYVELTVASDMGIGLLFYIAISSLGVYAVTLAGWSSNNKYALMGGMRAAAQLISYELILGLTAAGVLLVANGSLNLQEILMGQTAEGIDVAATSAMMETTGRFIPVAAAQAAPWWHVHQWNVWHYNIWAQPIGFLFFLVGVFAETNRLPFDLAEGESELTGGFHTEYTGIRFALFFLAEYIHMIIASAILATLYLGGWTNPFATGWSATHPLFGVVWFSAKVGVFMFFFVFVRANLPRFRYDQLMHFSWKWMLPVAIANLFVTALVLLVFPGAAWPALFLVNLAIIVAYELRRRNRPTLADERRREFRYVT